MLIKNTTQMQKYKYKPRMTMLTLKVTNTTFLDATEMRNYLGLLYGAP